MLIGILIFIKIWKRLGSYVNNIGNIFNNREDIDPYVYITVDENTVTIKFIKANYKVILYISYYMYFIFGLFLFVFS